MKEGITAGEAEGHPARYALVEVENIHDPALAFHPIHRVVFHADGEALLSDWAAYCAARGMALGMGPAREGGQGITLVHGGTETDVTVQNPDSALAVGTLQRYLDDYLARNRDARIDYIHGEDTVRGLCGEGGAVGFLVPGLDKAMLLPAVLRDGALPRKTFSMGEAHEKRFYMECRRIV